MSDQRPFLTAQWRHLAMLNYRVDPQLLGRLVPRGTEIDLYDGEAYISLVGFMFLRTAVLGVPIPLHRNFEELNLRFYVLRRVGDEIRRGVVFIKEIVPRWAIAFVARRAYNENYVAVPMRHRLTLDVDGRCTDAPVEYGFKTAGQWNHLRIRPHGPLNYPQVGSSEEFITEHYWGYCSQRDGGTVEYRVEHPQWELRAAQNAEFACDVGKFYGEAFVEPLSAAPDSALLADGSDVAVYRPVRIL